MYGSGMATGLHEEVSVRDVGIYGITHADGLAVQDLQDLLERLMDPILSGVFTLEDYKLYDYLRYLDSSEHKRIEPSSCAAFEGPVILLKHEERENMLKRK